MNECPSWERLSAWQEGELPAPDGETLRLHLASCAVCRESIRELKRAGEALRHSRSEVSPTFLGQIPPEKAEPTTEWQEPIGPHSRRALSSVFRKPVFPWKRVATAASLVLLASAWFFLPKREWTASGNFDRDRVRIEAQEDCRWRWDDRQAHMVRVETGRAEFEALAGGEGFTVETPAGSVKVLGTRFSVRMVEIPPIPGDEIPLRSAVVEVKDGRVELQGDEGIQPLSAGQRGLLLAGREPYPMAPQPQTIPLHEFELVWNNWKSAHRKEDREAYVLYATILASYGGQVRPYVEKKASGEDPNEAEYVRMALNILGEKATRGG